MGRLSYPHMGSSVIAVNAMARTMGFEIVAPRAPTQNTLTLGTRHSPEFACIPFKIVLGTYIESLERGANVILSGGGKGPCRAGYYGELHRRILLDLGYEHEMIFFWPPLRTPMDFLRKLRRFKAIAGASWGDVGRAIRMTWEKLKAIDDLEILAHRLRPRELTPGDTSRALSAAMTDLDAAETVAGTRTALAEGTQMLDSVATGEGDPEGLLKIGIIGEIYVQLEPFANFGIEERLGELGAWVQRSIFLTNFARTDILARGDRSVARTASEYLPENVGGHGQSSVGEIIEYAHKGFDGVVQLAPFSCIPEIVAKSIVPSVSREYGIPVMTLFIDEQTGEGGVQTRLEAFVDLLRARRRRGKDLEHAALSGS